MKNLTGLERTIRFQKAVRSADRAATPGEADAAMNAARRLMEAYQIDPVTLHVGSFYDRGSFATARRWQSSAPSICSRREGRPSRQRATSMRPCWQSAASATGRSRRRRHGPSGRNTWRTGKSTRSTGACQASSTSKTRNARTVDRSGPSWGGVGCPARERRAQPSYRCVAGRCRVFRIAG